MSQTIFLEVEQNENCDEMPMLVYEALADPSPIQKVMVFEPSRPHGIYKVTGWSSAAGGTPCAALYMPVADSGQAEVQLVFGGDWGIRLKPDSSEEEWNIHSPEQWGEPYLMLTDKKDLLL